MTATKAPTVTTESWCLQHGANPPVVLINERDGSYPRCGHCHTPLQYIETLEVEFLTTAINGRRLLAGEKR